MASIDKTKLDKKLTDKYVVENETFKREVKSKPKDKIEVEIGDALQPDFKPQVKIKRWTNEVNFSLRAEEDPTAKVETNGEKIKYKAKDYEVVMYDLPEASEDGGFEFEWILPKKPPTNVLTATIEIKNLDFFYQPALTQGEIDEGAERPENVVGSYAVYHKTKGGMNRASGKEYKVGKAFHIYRPKVTDANGDSIYGDLNIDEQNGLLTVTIDQTWLDNAVYPVTIDPTFGYTSVGASNFSSTNDYLIIYKATLPEDGSVTNISYYNKTSSNDDGPMAMAIYLLDGNGSDSHTLEANTAQISSPISGDWNPTDITASLVADDYILALWGNEQSPAYDDIVDTKYGSEIITFNPASWPDPHNDNFHLARDVSIYATYTDTATGDSLYTWGPVDAVLPDTSQATYDSRNSHPTLDFDASADESAIFEGVMPRTYGGGGVKLYIHFSMTSATSGNVVVEASFERIGDQQQDIDSDGFAAANSATITVPGGSGLVDYVPITFTDGADMDSVAAGESFRLKITRNADDAGDTASGDFELLMIEMREQ